MAMTVPGDDGYPAVMKRFDLRLPDDLHDRLVVLAERERRSIHAQILRLIEEGLDRAEVRGSKVND
jgi:predicted transcriptional regulator